MQNHISVQIDQAIDEELGRLPNALIKDLRERWKDLFMSDPPKAFGPDLLRRAIAQKIQEQAYGGLNPSAQRELNQIIKLHSSKSGSKAELPRRIKPGALVLREWKGQTHRVTAHELTAFLRQPSEKLSQPIPLNFSKPSGPTSILKVRVIAVKSARNPTNSGFRTPELKTS